MPATVNSSMYFVNDCSRIQIDIEFVGFYRLRLFPTVSQPQNCSSYVAAVSRVNNQIKRLILFNQSLFNQIVIICRDYQQWGLRSNFGKILMDRTWPNLSIKWRENLL